MTTTTTTKQLTIRDLEQRAYAALPDYDRFGDLIAQAKEQLSALGRGKPDLAVLQEVAAEVRKSGQLPAEPESALVAARELQQRRVDRATVLEFVITDLTSLRNEALGSPTGKAFDVLGEELGRIMEEVADLGSVPFDADDAIEKGRVAEYQALNRLVDEATLVRTVWQRFMSVADTNVRRLGNIAGWLTADAVLEYDPAVHHELVGGAVDAAGRPALDIGSAWPGYRVAGPGSGQWPVDDHAVPSFVVWASERKALTAPSPKQLAAATAAITRQVNLAVAERHDPREAAHQRDRDRYEARQMEQQAGR